MLFNIIKFELQYRLRRPATYIYFGVMFLMAFGAMSSDVIQIGGGAGLVKENAPSTIANMMTILSAFFMMITSAIMGVAVLRDFDHKMESLMFSNPIKKFDYLFGRFIGSFIILVFVFTGVVFGFIVGEFMPWKDADKLLAFNLNNYLHPFIYFVLPNLFFSGALFFVAGALSRRMVMVYLQWIGLFIIYQIAAILFTEIDNQTLAGILDPFALNTISLETQYWTVNELNAQTIPIEGSVLYNRLIWIGFGFVCLIAGYFGFSFNVVRSSLFKKKAISTAKSTRGNENIAIPEASQTFSFATTLQQIKGQSWFYFMQVLKSIPFSAIAVFGIFILVVNSFFIGRVFGVYTYPTTGNILQLISGFRLFFIIIIVVYTAELIWKEREVKINLIYDAMPVRDFTNLFSKFLGLVYTYVFLLCILILTGVAIQTFKGYYEYELGLYFGTLFTNELFYLILFTLAGFFVHSMVNNKYIGIACMVLFFISTLVLGPLGIEHRMFRFGSSTLGPYSDMNGYGHYVEGFNWFNIYWFALAILLFAVAILFAARGSEAIMKTRWKVSKLRLNRSMLTMIIATFLIFTMSGCYIYYNSNVLNQYTNSDDFQKQQAEYEKALKKFENINQPKIKDVKVDVDIYPKGRDYKATGRYILNNEGDEAIADIHVQLNTTSIITTDTIYFDRTSKLKESFDDFGYKIYALDKPLMPGEKMEMHFKTQLNNVGFVEGSPNNSVVFNGTFFNSTDFPTFGYNGGFEIVSDNDRKDHDLLPRERSMERDNPVGLAQGALGDDARGIMFEITVSTDSSQVAIAPGYLQKEWLEGDRRYFNYKMDVPMENFYNIISARYEVMRDKTIIPLDSGEREISLEIYYHEGHEYNLERMMKSMKKSFAYFSEVFSPYQYRQMRILEFPRYASFAQSFANTVPFSEGIGFMLEIKEEDDVDVAFYVTAHELGHQWWAHQVMPANVKGGTMIIETLAQYSALMVMKHEYEMIHMKEFLKEEMNRYLTGRALEQKKELPLALVENQQYIHYGKGAVNMFALQDYISEDSVNAALKRFIRDWKDFETNNRYSTTNDLLGYFKEVTPDSLQYVISDLFEQIVLFENKVDLASYEEQSNDKWLVELEVSSKKIVADTLGAENNVGVNDWIDIGVYGTDDEGEEKLLYLKKHKIDQEKMTVKVEVDEKPTKAGIDPINKLIDRNPDDNTKVLSEKEGAI